MPRKIEPKKLVVVEVNGPISELGGIQGPIINPCSLPVKTIVQMVGSHKKVFEVNPFNQSERVRLTLKNVNSVNFQPPIARQTLKEATKKVAQKSEVKASEIKKEDQTNNSLVADFVKK